MLGFLIPKKLSNDDCKCEELNQQFKILLSHFMKLNILATNHCDNALTISGVFCKVSASPIYLGSNHLIERNIDLMSFFSLFGYSKVQRSFLCSQNNVDIE